MSSEEFSEALKLFEGFRAHYNQVPCDLNKCEEIICELKIRLTQFSFLLPHAGPSDRTRELLLSREILEMATLLSIRLKNIEAFDRNFAQLKPYYYDYSEKLPASERQYALLGLNLLRLLSGNRLGEFHTELELIPTDHQHHDPFILHPLQLERYLMEGSYSKVWKARQEVPREEFLYFIDELMMTVRGEISDCCQSAYHSLPVQAAQKLLMFSSTHETLDYACNKSEMEKNWIREGDAFVFREEQKSTVNIPTMQLIHETLAYAKELEQIV